jgi:hypothetical protein
MGRTLLREGENRIYKEYTKRCQRILAFKLFKCNRGLKCVWESGRR